MKKILYLGIMLFLLLGCSPAIGTEDGQPEPAEGQEEDEQQSAPLVKETAPATPAQTPKILPDIIEIDEKELVEATPIIIVPTDKTDQSAQFIPGDIAMETVDEIITALSQALDVQVDEVEPGVIEEVTWPDGSLGCPVEGMAYMQVLTQGRRVILRVAGVEYHFHARGSGPFRYCANPQPPVPAPQPGSGVNQPPPAGTDN